MAITSSTVEMCLGMSPQTPSIPDTSNDQMGLFGVTTKHKAAARSGAWNALLLIMDMETLSQSIPINQKTSGTAKTAFRVNQYWDVSPYENKSTVYSILSTLKKSFNKWPLRQ